MTAPSAEWSQDQAVELDTLGVEPLVIREVPMTTDPVFALITAAETMDQIADELEAVQALVAAPDAARDSGESETRVALTLTMRQVRGLGGCLGHLVEQLRAASEETLAQSELAKAG